MSRTTLAFLFIGLTGVVIALLFSLIGTTIHPPLQPPADDRARPALAIAGHVLTVIGAIGVVANTTLRKVLDARKRPDRAPATRLHAESAAFSQIQTLTMRQRFWRIL